MPAPGWIVASGVGICGLALVGGLTLLPPFAAGSFLHIAASDPVPEVTHDHGLRDDAIHLTALVSGIALLHAVRAMLER